MNKAVAAVSTQKATARNRRGAIRRYSAWETGWHPIVPAKYCRTLFVRFARSCLGGGREFRDEIERLVQSAGGQGQPGPGRLTGHRRDKVVGTGQRLAGRRQENITRPDAGGFADAADR